MSRVWQCVRCFALHFLGEPLCMRCGAPRPGPSLPVIHPRAACSQPVHLELPPLDFPYTRPQREDVRRGAWVGPAALLLLAVMVALTWDPLAVRLAPARALGGGSAEAGVARRAELDSATRRLDALVDARALTTDPERWRARVQDAGRRWHIDGRTTHSTLAGLEVRVRAVWLELVSTPDNLPQDQLTSRFSTAKEELSSVSEDLSHVR